MLTQFQLIDNMRESSLDFNWQINRLSAKACNDMT